MGFDAGILVSVALGIVLGGCLTGWCLWSRHQELKDDHNSVR